MRILPSSAVVDRRRLTLLVLRAAATFMVVYGAAHMLRAIGIAFGFAASGSPFIQQLISTFYSNNYNPFWYGFSIAVPGMVLGYVSRRISRWIVPADANECPACGYTLRQLTASRCPECGYSIASSGDQSSSSPR